MAIEQLKAQDTNRQVLYLVENIKGVRTLGYIPEHLIVPSNATYNKAPYGMEPGVFTFDQEYDHTTSLCDESELLIPEHHTFITGWHNLNNAPYMLLSDNLNKIFRIIPAVFKDPTVKDLHIAKITSYIPSYSGDQTSTDVYTNDYPVVELTNYPKYITIKRTTTVTSSTTDSTSTSSITGTIDTKTSGTINADVNSNSDDDDDCDTDDGWWHGFLRSSNDNSNTIDSIEGTTSSTSTSDVNLTATTKTKSSTTVTTDTTTTTETVVDPDTTTPPPSTPSLEVSVILVYWNNWSIRRFIKIKLPTSITFTGDTIINNNGLLSYKPVSNIESDTIYMPMDFTNRPSKVF